MSHTDSSKLHNRLCSQGLSSDILSYAIEYGSIAKAILTSAMPLNVKEPTDANIGIGSKQNKSAITRA